MPVQIGELEISPAPAPAGPPPAAQAEPAATAREPDAATLATARRLQLAQQELALRVYAH